MAHDCRWIAINRASANDFERVYGVRPRVGDRLPDLLADKPEDLAAVKALWTRALAGEEFTEIAANSRIPAMARASTR